MKSIVLLTALLSFVSVARATVTETFTHTYPLTADGAIRVENVNGDIDITAWEKPEVSLVAEKRAKNDDELKRVEIIIEAGPDRLAIKTKHIKKTGGWFFSNWSDNSSVRYKLMVPAGARLEKIDTVNSDITASGMHGPVKLSTVNGGIEDTGLRGDARLNAVNGSLRAEFASLENVREIELDSVNGRAMVTLPKGASARIETSTVNGSSHVDQPINLSKSGRRSLSGEIGTGGGPNISLETVNGSISVREK